MKRVNNLLILAYHSISNIRKDTLAVNSLEFEKQLNWVKKYLYEFLIHPKGCE